MFSCKAPMIQAGPGGAPVNNSEQFFVRPLEPQVGPAQNVNTAGWEEVLGHSLALGQWKAWLNIKQKEWF